MPNCSTLTTESRFMGLFVGPSKHGKTVAACSFPGPIKVMDFDGRIRGILGAEWIDKSTIDYDYYPPRVGHNDKPTYEKVNADLDMLLINSSQGNNRYKTLIVDSLTSAAFAMLCDAIPLTHQKGKGKSIGTLKMPDPGDYGFEAINIGNLLACLRSIPNMNIIVTAHVIDKYGKADPDDPYSERVVVGEKLSLRDKIAENTGIYFDHCFRFNKEILGTDEAKNTMFTPGQEKYTVLFRSELAGTSFAKLPTGKVNITGKSFYNELMRLAKEGK